MNISADFWDKSLFYPWKERSLFVPVFAGTLLARPCIMRIGLDWIGLASEERLRRRMTKDGLFKNMSFMQRRIGWKWAITNCFFFGSAFRCLWPVRLPVARLLKTHIDGMKYVSEVFCSSTQMLTGISSYYVFIL